MPPKKQRLLNLPGQKTLFNFSFSNSKDDNNNLVDTNTNTAIDKSTDHGDDINPDIALQVIGLKGVMLLILHPILEMGASVC